MPTKFIHTADLQLGKPFASVRNEQSRHRLRESRFAVTGAIRALVQERGASFVVIAGDLFDSSSADKPTVARGLEALGGLGVDVYIIPGNHDHGGQGSLWQQEFFQQELARYRERIHILRERKPVVRGDAVILPAPLLSIRESDDPTTWIRDAFSADTSVPADRPRIVLAHGSVQDFSATGEDDDEESRAANHIMLERLPAREIDYIALGDWHGMKVIPRYSKAWYSGTPEIDRHPKGEANRPGHVLVVEASRGLEPKVDPVVTTGIRWITHTTELAAGQVARLDAHLEALLGTTLSDSVLQLTLTGILGLQDRVELSRRIESIRARLVDLQLSDLTVAQPSPEERASLTGRSSDPLIQSVAARLLQQLESGGAEGRKADLALQLLYTEIHEGHGA
jgi:DNA repair exonuclease SbcCD nuclease subunit